MGTKDISASIRAGRELLMQIEANSEMNPPDASVIELKRIIHHRIAELESELISVESSPAEDHLRQAENCLFLQN